MDFLNAARKDDDELNLIMRDCEIFSDKMGPDGFSVTLKSQHVSVTHYTVSKNGVTDSFDFPTGDENLNCKKYMEQFGRNFELLRELIELRKAVKN